MVGTETLDVQSIIRTPDQRIQVFISSPTNVSRVIRQFKKLKIVRNFTPKEQIGGIYGLTPFGSSFKTEFLKHLAFRATKASRYSNP